MGSVADRITLRTLLGTLAATLAAGAAHSQAAHTSMGETPPLFDGLGRLHHAITTTVPLAQRYFDQGLTLVYAFNHEEAIASFTEAARLDSTCAMCYWGIALALGPNINVPMDSAAGVAAYAAVRRALALRAHATPRERCRASVARGLAPRRRAACRIGVLKRAAHPPRPSLASAATLTSGSAAPASRTSPLRTKATRKRIWPAISLIAMRLRMSVCISAPRDG